MLSIEPLKSAKGACDYYLKAFDYYQGDATATAWLGSAKDYLNLPNEVDQKTMLDLLQGILPDGKKLQNLQGEHRPGFDMTFSAPKSVSLLVGLGVASELIGYHDEAVKYALSQIEHEFAEARVSRNGEVHYEKTGNLVIAAFRQLSSRENDPALHTHCVAMNLTFLDGVARSLSSDKQRQHGVIEQIQNNAHYCGLLYRHHLANSLKEAGFSLRLTNNGLFEIDGISSHILRDFSTRRKDIEQCMEDHGLVGARAASKAALMTRQTKEEHDLETLTAEWQARAIELGFNAETFMRTREQQKTSESLFSIIKEKLRSYLTPSDKNQKASEIDAAYACVQVAIESLSQRTSVFSERKLKFESLKHSLSHDTAIAANLINQVIQQEKKAQNLYESKCTDTSQVILTTPWLLTLEAESITRIENNKGVLPSIASINKVESFQKEVDNKRALPMTDSQKQAMMAILTTKDRYLAVQGYAGVAKTTMLSEARVLIESQGYKLRGITVASSAANELQTKAGISSDVFPVVHQELKNSKAGSLSKTVFIVDEASMLSSPQGHELMKRIELTHARLILVGDKAQLPSVNNGRLFSLTQEYGIETAVMDEIVRQKNPKALASVLHATKGEVREAINKLEHVEELPNHAERIKWIAQHWLSLNTTKRAETLLFAPTHAHREAITELLRAGLGKEGSLSGLAHIQVALKAKAMETIQQRFVAYYQSGDIIRFNQDIQQNKLKREQYYTVGPITKNHRQDNVLPLINIQGKTQLFALKNLPQYKTHTAAFERIIEVYQAKTLELKVGDQVMWCRNFKADNIRNGQRATLTSLNDTELTFLLEHGSQLTLNKIHPALKHLDYGYVLTNYKVQGKDAQYGIGLMESHSRFSATLKNFYVQISRAVVGMTLVTDSRERLIDAIHKNTDDKMASIDILSSQQLKDHDLRFKHTMNIQPAIDKKINMEYEIKSNEVYAKNKITELSFTKDNHMQKNSKELVKLIEF